MAPEMVQGQDYGIEVDWWSMGILLFDMLTGSPPWTDKNEKKLCDLILGAKLVLPNYLSPEVQVLCSFVFCLIGIVSQRPLQVHSARTASA